MFQHKQDEAPLSFEPPFSLEEIVEIEELDYDGYVYDIEVEDDHSFVANNIIAHNCICTLVPIHEKPEEFVQKLKRWKENPGNEPNIEMWYQNIYRQQGVMR